MFGRLITISCFFFVLTNAYLGGRASSHAEALLPKKLSSQDENDLKRVKEYLEGIKTLKGGFLQISSNGSTASGKVFMLEMSATW